MGTPIRHPSTTNGPHFWYNRLWSALRLCRGPQLKYLLDFKEFGTIAFDTTLGCDALRTTDENTRREVCPNIPTIFPFDADTQCVILATTPERRWQASTEKIKRTYGSHYSGRFVERKHLLLTRNGRFVEWLWRAEERDDTMHDVGGYVTEVAVLHKVSLDMTIGLAGWDEKIAEEALRTLHKLLNDKLDKEEWRLNVKRNMIEPINLMVGQILGA